MKRSHQHQRKRLPDPPSTDEILDRQEQEQIVADFESANRQILRLWKLVFSTLAMIVSAFYLYCALLQMVDPFGGAVNGRLLPTRVPPATITWLHMLSALPYHLVALSFAHGALFSPMPDSTPLLQRDAPRALSLPQAARAAVLISLLSAIGWMRILLPTSLLEEHRVLWYLPLGPIVYCGLAYYINYSLSSLHDEVYELRKAMYDAKTL